MDRERVGVEDPTVLLVNPASRHGRTAFEQYRARLARQLNLVEAAMPPGQEALTEAILEGLARGVTRFVVGGGDGTLGLAAALLKQSAGVLGVLPLGTGNTFALGLNMPTQADAIVDVLAKGRVMRYDVAEAQAQGECRVFLNSLTVGVSERLVELLTPDAKRRWGWLAWPVNVRKAMRATAPFGVRLQWSGGREEYVTRQLAVVNGRTLAGPVMPTPHSSGRDALLEVFRLGGASEWSLIRVTVRLLQGKLLKARDARYMMVSEVTIDTVPRVPVDIDGEVWRAPPVTCRVLPGVLAVITPDAPGSTAHRWPMATRALGVKPRSLVPGQHPAGYGPGRW
ncbi:MAG: diacylglycerol kinase family protein [Thermaerobacter sp.]|nr:diacylglycerol kinase family protein [Thermaerobacter sp.]